MHAEGKRRAGAAVHEAMEHARLPVEMLAALSMLDRSSLQALLDGKRLLFSWQRERIEVALGWERGRIGRIARGEGVERWWERQNRTGNGTGRKFRDTERVERATVSISNGLADRLPAMASTAHVNDPDESPKVVYVREPETTTEHLTDAHLRMIALRAATDVVSHDIRIRRDEDDGVDKGAETLEVAERFHAWLGGRG